MPPLQTIAGSRRSRLQQAFLVAIASLAVGHLVYVGLDEALHFSAKGLLGRLDLTSEQNVGTWFTSGVLGLAAALAAALASITAGRVVRRGWWALAALLALLSLDEVAALHEWSGEVVAAAVEDLPPALAFAWMIPALVLLAAFVAWQRRFLTTLPRPLARRLLAAAAIFVGGAVGLEMVESALYTESGEVTLAYMLVAGVEETLEMLGAVLLLGALLRHLAEHAPLWRVELAPMRVALRPTDHGAIDRWPPAVVRGPWSDVEDDDRLAAEASSAAPR